MTTPLLQDGTDTPCGIFLYDFFLSLTIFYRFTKNNFIFQFSLDIWSTVVAGWSNTVKLSDTEHEFTTSRHVICIEKTVSACAEVNGACCSFSRHRLLFPDGPDVSSSWPLHSTFEMLRPSSLFSIRDWKFLSCGLGLWKKDGRIFKSLFAIFCPSFFFNSFIEIDLVNVLDVRMGRWSYTIVQLPYFWILDCSEQEVLCG